MRPGVRENCPVACKTCCSDSKSFVFRSKEDSIRKCAWLKQQPKRKRDEYCRSKYKSIKVSTQCPKVCGTCDEEIIVYDTIVEGSEPSSIDVSLDKISNISN